MKRVFSIHERGKGSNASVKFAWQRNVGNYIASAGLDSVVNIHDRHGNLVEEINITGRCTALEWDEDGDILAIICEKSSYVSLWDSNGHRVTQLESGFRDNLTCLVWSHQGTILAVGTAKGNLLLYNHQTSRKVPIIGKHTKRITCGAWSKQSLLALGSDDKSVSISNVDGDTVSQTSVRSEPMQLQFSEMKSDSSVSAVLDKKSLFFYNIEDDNPVELAFQQRYGHIQQYRWYGDGYIMIGFSNGFFVVVSTHMKEIGQELFQARNHKDYLSAIAISHSLNKAASAGDNCVKIHDLSDLKQMHAIVTLDDERNIDGLQWTDDGQLMAVSTPRGAVHIYLTRLPMLSGVYGSRYAYMTSLLEITYQDSNRQEDMPITLIAEIEPSYIALGAYHLAVGMNNIAWFYVFTEYGFQKLQEREYLSTIQQCKIGTDYAAVMYDDKLSLHLIETTSDQSEERENRLFPDAQKEKSQKITSFYINSDFLIYSTDMGGLYYFLIEDWAYVNEYRHIVAIRDIFPNASGTRVLFIDDKSDAFIYNPINDNTIEITQFTSLMKAVIWDASNQTVFISYDNDNIYTFVYNHESITAIRSIGLYRSQISLKGTTKLPYDHRPLNLTDGDVILHTSSGKVVTLTLNSHVLETDSTAWTYCEILNDDEKWRKLGKLSLKVLNLDFALKVYRQIGDTGMIQSLQAIKEIEDYNLLTGYLAMFLDDFDVAQELFLESSKPKAALDMRRDLLQWESALKLAKVLAPDEINYISKEYGQQLEFTCDYLNALTHYEKGITNRKSLAEHDEICKGGVARMSIRMGDIRKGVSLASSIQSKVLKKDCAAILENMKQWSDAGTLYEKGEYYDKAAAVYIRSKQWNKVGELLDKVSSAKIHGQYARAKEAEGRFKDAVKAYASAGDMDNVIRINLEHLQNPEEAVEIVQRTHSIEGAKMVARFFLNLNDYSSAIQFLVLSRCNDEAFQIAQKHDKMEIYADIIGTDATLMDYQSIAVHFENVNNFFLAGKFFLFCENYAKALKYFLRCPATQTDQNGEIPSLEMAIMTIGQANSDTLTRQLIGYLMGEVDGTPKAMNNALKCADDRGIDVAIKVIEVTNENSYTDRLLDNLMGVQDGKPKDAKYLFRLYMALKQYREAARTAIIISREEQNSGNYRNAHDVLFSMYQELRKNDIKIPSEMYVNLMILHSYILVKMHVKRGDHLKGARMLIRVANNISKFPSHIVPILTSTVIECFRTGLMASSFSYAAMLMRPEYRDQIDSKYRKKIETIIRKPDKSELEEENTECPYCEFKIPATSLMCNDCKNTIPYCIITGRHIVKDDLTICPSCKFPAILSEFKKLCDLEIACPMCGVHVLSTDLGPIKDTASILSNSQIDK